MNFKTILKRVKNPGTVIAIASATVLILTTLGIQIDNEKIMTTVKSLCAIGVLLGCMNNPDTPGLDLPFVTKKNKKAK